MSLAADLPVGRCTRSLGVLLAYALPGAIAWGGVGLLMNCLSVGDALLAAIIIYATYYGAIESNGKGGLPPPGAKWQVPKTFVQQRPRWRRLLTWGVILGPGFATRNPYAGFALLPLAVAVPHDLVSGVLLGAAVGVLHGTGRGLALMRDARAVEGSDFLDSVVRSMYWRIFDGLALLAIGGAALAKVLQ